MDSQPSPETNLVATTTSSTKAATASIMRKKKNSTRVCPSKKETLTDSKMELSTKVNGRGTCVMVMEFRFGQTGQGMKGSGGRIKLMEEANFGTLMETCLTESGRMIKPMVMGFTLM